MFGTKTMSNKWLRLTSSYSIIDLAYVWPRALNKITSTTSCLDLPTSVGNISMLQSVDPYSLRMCGKILVEWCANVDTKQIEK